MARPELLDRRPGWGGGKLNATTVLLEPLSADETRDAHRGAARRPAARDERCAPGSSRPRRATRSSSRRWSRCCASRRSGERRSCRPTIQALLAARLDRLDPAERGVLERGAVEGRVFHRGAVAGARPGRRRRRPTRLTALVRKELIRPDRPQIPGEDAFRFRHLLIRDAAYDSLPKAVRAELHERFADWLDEHGATSSSSTRSSATTSSRPTVTASSSARSTMLLGASPVVRAATWRPPDAGRTPAATSARRSRSSNGEWSCFLPRGRASTSG